MSRRTLPGFLRLPLCGLTLACIALSAGCGGKDAVALSVFMSNASLEVKPATLGSQLEGSFSLRFDLGPEAPKDTEVSIESFALAPASSTEDLGITFTPETEEMFPLTLSAGDKRSAVFTVSDITLSAEQLKAICAETVEIRGSVRDTLSDDGISSVRSGAISVAGCP